MSNPKPNPKRNGPGKPGNQYQMLPSEDHLRAKVPSRTTKTSQKLTLFPDEMLSTQPYMASTDETVVEAEDLYDQLAIVPPERIGKLDRKKLPRVSAYCTANSYRIDDLVHFYQLRACHRPPKKFDECVYLALPTAFSSYPPLSSSNPNLHDETLVKNKTGDLFFFDYGVVVTWGLTEEEEKSVLMELMPFEEDSLGFANIETEKFAFHYNTNYQSRIYNDIISLKDPDNYMTKLTISHAIAQSTKLTLFEGLVDQTIAATKHIPQTMADTGKVPMNRTAITKKIGQLFIMRINVNLVSNVLDTPELFWAEPLFEPLYQALRRYLEINQRVELLNQRVSVISDLLDMLKEHLNSTHGEKLEWIVIILIAFEIVIGIITICFDFLGYSGRPGVYQALPK